MGAGAATTTGVQAAYGHLLDPRRKWYNNRRYALLLSQFLKISDHCGLRIIVLNAWIVLLYATSFTPFHVYLILTTHLA